MSGDHSDDDHRPPKPPMSTSPSQPKSPPPPPKSQPPPPPPLPSSPMNLSPAPPPPKSPPPLPSSPVDLSLQPRPPSTVLLPPTKMTYLRPKKAIPHGREDKSMPPMMKSSPKLRVPEWPESPMIDPPFHRVTDLGGKRIPLVDYSSMFRAPGKYSASYEPKEAPVEDIPVSSSKIDDDFSQNDHPSVFGCEEGPLDDQYTSVDSIGNQSDYTPDELRTVVISGLPSDLQEREIFNIFRWLPGALFSRRGSSEGSVILRIQFSTLAQAKDAKNKLNELLFDPDEHIILRAELASNDVPLHRGFGTKSRPSQGLRIGDSKPSIPLPPQFGTGIASGPSNELRIGGKSFAEYTSGLPSVPDISDWTLPPYVNLSAHVQNPFDVQLPDHGLDILAENQRKSKESQKQYNKVGYKYDNKKGFTDEVRTCGQDKQIKNLQQEEVTVSIVEFEDQDDDAISHQNDTPHYGVLIQFKNKHPFGRPMPGTADDP